MPAFPSLEWFEALRTEVNNDPGFRHFGMVDARVGIKVGDQAFEVVFEAFDCESVREVSDAELGDCDFWLEQPPQAWSEMLLNIKQNGSADADHTLNTLDLLLPESLARSTDGYKRDLFYRFNQTLQDFFNAASRLETTFRTSPAVAGAS